MLFEIFKFELRYRASRPETYIYFIITFVYSLLAAGLLVDGRSGGVIINSPHSIAITMAITSAFFMVVNSMIMGVSVLRDFQHKMESMMFVNPISKIEYLGGRFLGSFVTLLIISMGILLGKFIGDYMPWIEAENLQDAALWHYIQPYLIFVLPNMFFGGVIFFVAGALSRKLMVVYVQGVVFLMGYILSLNVLRGLGSQFIAGILDPFSYQTVRFITRYWTEVERNTQMIPLEGTLLYNRLFWIGLGVVAMAVGYYSFKFSAVRDKASRKQRDERAGKGENTIQEAVKSVLPAYTLHFDIKARLQQVKQLALFHFKGILNEVPFWGLVLCSMILMMVSSFNLRTTYGVDSYPATHILVQELAETSALFFLAIIVFYSGELVWRERDSKLSLISDSLPVPGFVDIIGKFLGLLLSYVVIIGILIATGISFQLGSEYYNLELGVYLLGFFVEIFPSLVIITVGCFFFQAIVNHKFLAHIVAVSFLFTSMILIRVLGYGHGLYTFGGNFLGTYSAMDGYGHFLETYAWLKVYWGAFMVLMMIGATVLGVRGTETNIGRRFRLASQRLSPVLLRLGIGAIAVFVLSGGYIFYNTNILNSYGSFHTQMAFRANYEKALKGFEYKPQPKIVDVNLNVDLYPSERDYIAEGSYVLVNKESAPIREIHIQKHPRSKVKLDYVRFKGGAAFDNAHEEFGHYIYRLNQPLQPRDSLNMEFKQVYSTPGFDESSEIQVVYNGTFFSNSQLPTLGYNNDIELEDESDRADYGLQPKARRALIDDARALKEGLSEDDGEEIDFEIVVSTDKNQTAIAPGYLQNSWTEGDRAYFHYKMDKPMTNFYSIVSARYEVMRDEWIPSHDSLGSPIALEIYYHKGHEYNLERMMKGMKKSFDYFSQHLGPYQYQQMRILEFPAYRSYAQSFPNTVPFSENIGFLLDIDDEEEVDMAFFITAHEIAHQWWGHQVNPANVQGKSMLSESLAQYSALMAFKEVYSEQRVQQLLALFRNRYLQGRTQEEVQEVPLALVESGQEYLHYGKGMTTFYALQDYIGEENVNLALRRFIQDWGSFTGLKKTQTERYATSEDLLGYIREAAPDSLQYVIEDLFETIILYDNKITEATYEELSDNQYKVKLTLDVTKYQVDSLGVEQAVSVNDWMDIGVYAKGEDGEEEFVYLVKHKITDKVTKLEIVVDRKPSRAGVDPKVKLVDRDGGDNVVGLTEEGG